MKLGSLFDGSGGFPLAGAMFGIEPVWAAEVEPYPIAVTKSRFPDMKHLGDVSKLNGANIEPVDIITFGSPCQDMSVAGKRAGLKHEDNGDEETTRSGLFMEAIRIIKEMRGATNGEYPRFAIWENVTGAFSSNKGEDFRTVLEEFIQINEPYAVMPSVPERGWAYADIFCGDGWSIAYRTLDAQYWGVPQRRRRIYLVADFRGERAKEILFECEGLRGYFTESRTPWKDFSTDAERCVGADDREGAIGLDCYNQQLTGEQTQTLRGTATDADHVPCTVYSVENHPADSRVDIDNSGTVQTLTSRMGTGGGKIVTTKPHYIVRRLTPTECARLQGFPDNWGHIEYAVYFTDEEYEFWLNVRNTHAAINGKPVKNYTKSQVLTWYNKLHTDSAEYKMWGNGIALPNALYVMQGIVMAIFGEMI